jgi:two-component system response regulator AtoC
MDQTVLVIDDEKAVRQMLESLLTREGYQVTTASNGEEGLEILESQGRDCFEYILCDVKMPKVDGLEFLRRARAQGCQASVVVMSGFGTVDTAIEAIKLGAYDYISKPFKVDEVLLTLRKAEERGRLIRENQELRKTLQHDYRFDNIVARNEKMRAIFDVVRKVADFRSNILLQGESGTGKALLARAIHFNSNRKDGPFVTVRCGAFPEGHLEVEVFGREGAESKDAGTLRRGAFEQAQGGTLFFDEVSGVPPLLQVRLLDALQGGRIRRVGGEREIPVDVRIVAATNRDLEKEVEGGKFREDLFYRLNVIPIRVPPLRDRKDDIPLLVDHFLKVYGGQTGRDIRSVTPDALDALIHYSWRGNVRELENVIERAVILADGPVVELEHLSPWIQDDRRTAFLGVSPEEYSVKKVVPRIEKELIVRALRKTRGNRTAASKLLEISHRAVLYKIKDYGIEGF